MSMPASGAHCPVSNKLPAGVLAQSALMSAAGRPIETA